MSRFTLTLLTLLGGAAVAAATTTIEITSAGPGQNSGEITVKGVLKCSAFSGGYVGQVWAWKDGLERIEITITKTVEDDPCNPTEITFEATSGGFASGTYNIVAHGGDYCVEVASGVSAAQPK